MPNAPHARDPDVAARATGPAGIPRSAGTWPVATTTRVAAARGLRPVPLPHRLRRGQRATTRRGQLMPFVPA